MTIYDLGPAIGPAIVGGTAFAGAALYLILDRFVLARRRLRRQVFSNLDSAYENGYFEPGEYLSDMTAHSLSYDLKMYAPDLDDKAPHQLLPYVRDWLFQKGIPCAG